MKGLIANYKKELRDLLVAFIFFIIIVIIFFITLNNNFSNALKDINNYSKINEKEINKIADISIDKIKLNEEVFNDSSLETLKNHVGHDSNSFLPGENKTIIITAHNDLQFKDIFKLKKKDKIIIKYNTKEYTYKITSTKVSSADIGINEKEELVLYTTYPKDNVGLSKTKYVIYSKLEGVKDEENKDN